MSTQNASARSALVAVILSLAATGLGQIYCGRIVRGLVMFLGSLLFAPAVVAAALLPTATVVLVGLILALLAVLGVYVFAVVDAFRLARRWLYAACGDITAQCFLLPPPLWARGEKVNTAPRSLPPAGFHACRRDWAGPPRPRSPCAP